jgi:hypothetical protein
MTHLVTLPAGKSGVRKSAGGYQRHPGSIWIDLHRSTLSNNEWIAANSSGLIATDPSIDSLMQKITQKHIDPANVAIAYITEDPL